MKLKTLAVLAVSGLMAASLAYVMPAFAEDSGDIDGSAPMQLAMGDDTGSASDSSTATADNSAATTDNSSNGASASNNSSSNNTNNANPDQGGTPDVASGDDDY